MITISHLSDLEKNLLVNCLFSEGIVSPQRKDLPPILKANDKLQKDGYSSRNRKDRPASFQTKKCAFPDDMCLANVGRHKPKMVSNYRRCRKCKTKAREKRTHYMCAECDVPSCNTTCFSSFPGK
ncbi:hypothetical protein NPIL_193661 [Nephila pilipes]|uniref:PiggyBac transposable element-derived protein 4 C-terminal zinc-ribbon domain-containing protein n=1 Tax=Nephila pilipes TaxID=299642 RepID=A0A8X6QCF5_NEPPI|nr:hypothetical protein NPIL_193661 [Nephila pilipes]